MAGFSSSIFPCCGRFEASQTAAGDFFNGLNLLCDVWVTMDL